MPPDNPSPFHLALENSGRSGSVSLFCGEREIASVSLPVGPRTTQSLAPVIKNLAHELPGGCRDLHFISVACGPGSFTGLRIGVTTAKTLAYAVQAELVAVNTLEILAFQALRNQPQEDPVLSEVIATAMTAYRNQVFAAIWRTDGHGYVLERPAQTYSVEVWRNLVESLTATARVLACGDGFRLGWLPGRNLCFTDPEAFQPQSRSLAMIAWQKYQAGERTDLWRLEPDYLRPSAAEEKLDG